MYLAAPTIEVAASLALAQWPISQELKAAEEVQARLLSRTTPQLSMLSVRRRLRTGAVHRRRLLQLSGSGQRA